MNARLPIVVGLAAALGCGARVGKEAPEQQAPYVFPHSTHVDADVACLNCHATIPKSTKLQSGVRDVQLPAHPSKTDACKDCHDTDPEVSVPKRVKPVRFTFDHSAHLPRVNGDCKKCHQKLTEKGDKEAVPPPMSACTSCHQHAQDYAQARCRPCHVDLKGYKPLTAFKHGSDWMRAHGTFAKPDAETCAACHDQTYCVECHSPTTAPARPSIIYPERVERSFIHRGDYVARHMIDEQANPASCRRCHGPAFCEACHVLQNLTITSPNFRDPHPPGWAQRGAGAQFHGDAARRDISNCAGCHDQGAGAICVNCHKVGGSVTTLGPNGPHPSSFISKHKSDDKQANPLCRTCHPAG